MKNLTMYTCFITIEDDTFAFSSKIKNEMEPFFADQFKPLQELNTKYNFSIDFKSSSLIEEVVRYKEDREYYESIEKISLIATLIRFPNVINMEEFRTAVIAKAGIINDSDEDSKWLSFLISNNLQMPWLSGSLKCIVGCDYTESSKDFGERKKYSEKELHLDSHDKIWSFPELFYGKNDFVIGEYHHYWYEKNEKLLKVSTLDNEILVNI